MLRTDLIDNLRLAALTLNITFVGLDLYVGFLSIICIIIRHIKGSSYQYARIEKILKNFFWNNFFMTVIGSMSLLTFLAPLEELSMAASVFSFALLQLIARLAVGFFFYKALRLSEAEIKRRAAEEAAEAEKREEEAHTFV